MSDIFALWRWNYLWKDRDIFINGFLTTFQAALGGLVLSIILGFLVGLASTSKNKFVRLICRIYVELFRNIPLTLQILFMYYGFVYGNINITKVAVGMLGLGLCSGAYISEIVRAGLGSISKGQFEAAYSQGLSYFQIMRIVIMPQMLRIILPPFVTQLATLILNTSVLSMIAGGDLLYVTNNWAANGTLSYGPAFLVCGILFFAICYPLTSMARKYEHKIYYGSR